MVKKSDLIDDVLALSDLTTEQRADVDAMCDEGLMPSQIARRMGIPSRVAADARRSWKRSKELEEKAMTPAPSSPVALAATDNPLQQMMAITQQQLQQTLLQAQIDAMLEQNRHRKEANKLEERERRLELSEREAQYRDDYAPKETIETSIDDYDFENNPLGAFAKFMKDINQKNNTAPDAIGSPQSNATPLTAKDLTDEEISAYVAKQPPTVIGKALMAIDTPYQPELEAVLIKNGVTPNNLPRIIEWLRKEKARRAGAKK